MVCKRTTLLLLLLAVHNRRTTYRFEPSVVDAFESGTFGIVSLSRLSKDSLSLHAVCQHEDHCTTASRIFTRRTLGWRLPNCRGFQPAIKITITAGHLSQLLRLKMRHIFRQSIIGSALAELQRTVRNVLPGLFFTTTTGQFDLYVTINWYERWFNSGNTVSLQIALIHPSTIITKTRTEPFIICS